MKKAISILVFILSIHFISSAQQFKITYPENTFKGPFTGKVLLFLSKDNKEPKDANVGIEFFPCMSVDAKNIKPGGFVMIDDKATSFPVKLSDIERGDYYVQAVWDRNLGGRAISGSPGNIFSKSEKVTLSKDYNKVYNILCTEMVPEPSFKETDFAKEMKVSSEYLSSFLKKPMTVDAAVVLPADYYKQPDKTYPVLFVAFGYGGDYHRFSGDTTIRGRIVDSIPFITVYLDGNCAGGHSVYANSDNNGPWGDALVKEFIPKLESKYRTNGARLLTGHSSGGWTVLYLQSHYPSVFTACWASSPDPVDFRNFQEIDLYKKQNMMYDSTGKLRNVATVAGFFTWSTTKMAYQQENVVYRGEQMHSFDYVFGPKGSNGLPITICDPVTGEVNPSVFEHWKNYDISNYLRSNWDKLKPALDGKIRVSVGEQDNFLLNGAVHLMDKEMKALKADMVFEYFPGDHFTVSTLEYRTKGNKFLADKYREWLGKNKKGF
jgi:S-formylglutathione hydrolase FrmB